MVPNTTPVVGTTKRRLMECNAKAIYTVLCGLIGPIFVKVMHYTLAKAILYKLKNVYEGDRKIKQARLQIYRIQFEELTMKEDEDIADCFHSVYEIVNTMSGIQ